MPTVRRSRLWTSISVCNELPIDFVQGAFYGQGREYLLLTDRDAGEPDPAVTRSACIPFSKLVSALTYGHVALVADLPATFLAVDYDYTKAFEWVSRTIPSRRKSCWAPTPGPMICTAKTGFTSSKSSRREAGVNLKCLSNPERMA